MAKIAYEIRHVLHALLRKKFDGIELKNFVLKSDKKKGKKDSVSEEEKKLHAERVAAVAKASWRMRMGMLNNSDKK